MGTGFDDMYKAHLLTEQSVLDLVDEYTLYVHYTGIHPLVLSRAYNAPYYRIDNYPSFSVFESTKSHIDYMWKDHATGESGTIFQLIQKIYGLGTSEEVLAIINEDFDLGYNGSSPPANRERVVLYPRPEGRQIKIRIKSKPFSVKGIRFWEQFNIGFSLLKKYNVTEVDYYWSWDEQESPTTTPDPTFAYRIGRYYQLYSPYASKLYKFRNDFPENYFFGYAQLPPTGDKLVIDKSSKDVIFCRRLGYDAVAGKSETTMIPHKKILELKSRFKEIYLTLDPDVAGKAQTEKYMSMYPWMKPRFLTEAKDKTDLCTAVGFSAAEQIIKRLLQ